MTVRNAAAILAGFDYMLTNRDDITRRYGKLKCAAQLLLTVYAMDLESGMRLPDWTALAMQTLADTLAACDAADDADEVSDG